MPLGRGLGSLISQQKTTIKPKSEKKEKSPKEQIQAGAVLFIDTNKIIPNPHQPREFFADSGMEDLVSSVKEHGILQPLVVSPLEEDKYELIAGERRFRAAKLSRLKQVPAIVRKANEQEKLELALIENLQREDLNPIEEARGYKHLTEDFGLTQAEVAKRVGKSRPVITNTMRLLNLAEDMQKALARGKISASAGRVLAGISDKTKQRALYEKILQGLTVKESEIRSKLAKPEAHTRRAMKDAALIDLEERLREALKTKVNLSKRGKTCKLVIECYSDDELNKIVKKLNC